MGTEVADRFRGGPWGMPDAATLEGLIIQAGFDEVRVSERRLPVSFEQGPSQLVASLPASGIAAEVQNLNSDGRQALEAIAAELLAPLVSGDRLQSEMTANIAIAVKPRA